MTAEHTEAEIRRRRMLQLTGLGAAAGMGGLAGCTGGSDGTETPTDEVTEAGGTVTETETEGTPVEATGKVVASHTYDPNTLDPAKYANITDMQIANNIFDTLTDYRIGTAKLQPGLATDWEFTNGGNSIEFSLREGVQFHKGYGELTASDVEAHLERINDPDTGSPVKPSLDQLGYQGVDIEDDYSFTINFSAPASPAPYLLGQQMGMIPPADAVEELGEDFEFNPVGAGPFEFTEFEPNTRTVITAFDDYHRDDRPKVQTVEYRPIPESQTAWSAFRSREIDIRRVNSSERLQQLRGRDNVKFSEAIGLITRFVGINTQVEPFDNKKVRQALNYASNDRSIVESVFPGLSTLSTSFVAPGVKHHTTEDVPSYDYDPEKAQQLLEEAGYGDGFETTWWVPQIGRFTSPATVFQNNWSEVGIDVNVEIKEVGSYVSTIFGSEHEIPLFIHSLGQDPVPDAFLYDSFHSNAWGPDGGNYWFYSNDDVDAWLEEATSSTDEERRAELFADIQRQITEDAPGIWIDHEKFIFPMQEYVNGFESDPMRRMEMETTSVDK
ncbi:ABC transporter substrate-binding protein [Halobaculum sp. EA56]|uniref:ABC transporter substrate-binding protein n=1 Tax=Halobaculum sp. EA56 TaxID=3421648 RepID=UPI003EBE26AF